MERIETELLVVGAGPAGLAAALAARGVFGGVEGRRGVVVLERLRPGRKLLVSGGGRCNFSHAGPMADFEPRYASQGPCRADRWLRHALRSFDNRAFVSFLESRGVKTLEDELGKLFPEDGRAASVLEAFLSALDESGSTLVKGERALSIAASGGRFTLGLESGRGIVAGRVVIATGGASYPATGSTGDGYALAASLGHTLLEPRPALAPIIVEPWPLAGLAGLSFPATRAELIRGGRVAERLEGDLLITHRGLSGPLVLDASGGMRAGDSLRFPLAPGLPPGPAGAQEAGERLIALFKEAPRRAVETCLRDFPLPDRTAAAVVALAGLPEGLKAAECPREARARLAALLSGYEARIGALGSWDEAMATAGGLSLDEVNPKTMESRILPGLFFAGEVLDYVGDTGGYNIQAAVSTGVAAGRSAARD